MFQLPLSQIPLFKNSDIAYISEAEALRPFYKHSPQLASFGVAIEQRRKFRPEQRQSLVKALQQQYQHLNTSPETQANIESLASGHTFTITTAHQPCLLSGPLYFVYKIVDAIALCRQLKTHYPQQHFVPVYWMGGEDHDFEEVNHLHLFGKRWEWKNPQGGAIGDYRIESLQPLLQEITAALGDSTEAQFLTQQINNCFSNHYDYGTAMLRWVNALFGRYGLVCLDSRLPELKRTMVPTFREELLHQPSEKNVLATLTQLESAGFKQQAHPRNINLFYLQRGIRERIVKEGNTYSVLNTGIVFSQTEILAELEENPQNFSPNVILRPLYQETILPNLAYIGGGGELAYWLQLKANFDFFGQPYPILLRRSSVLLIDEAQKKRWLQWGFNFDLQLFEDSDALVKNWLQRQAEGEISLSEENNKWKKEFELLAQKVKNIDASLVGQVEAQLQSQLQWLDKMEKRLIKTEKQRHDTSIQQIQRWREKLFPNNGLQERHDNFMNFYLKQGESFFEVLLEHLNPLKKLFWIIEG